MSGVSDDEWTEAVDADIPRVDLVGHAANGVPAFLLMKSDGPRGLLDAETVRDLIAKAEPEQQETVTMTGSPAAIAAMIHQAAVRKTETDVSKDMGPMELDDIDLTEVLAQPEVDAPGNPTTPGSPAWEAIDAATACKWTAVLGRARAAIDVMAEREMLEAASSDDGDAGSAWDLQDACCAIDYAISVLAPFAVGEHAEAEMGADMLEAVGKAVADAASPLEVIEGLAPVCKAGRVLSSANEAAIRGAVEQLQKVLASLPAAPAVADETVAKVANEEPDMPKSTPAEVATATSGQQPAMGTAAVEPKSGAGVPVTDVTKADGDGETEVAKAKGDPQMVVYDKNGNPVGIVDPEKLIPIAEAKAPGGAGGDEVSADNSDGEEADEAETAEPPTDLVPAPADETGTPADAVQPEPADDEGGDMTKSENTTTLIKSTVAEMLKAALDEHSAEQADLVKNLQETSAGQAELLKTLEGQIAAKDEQIAEMSKRIDDLANAPAVREVVRNGAMPPAHLMRGQDYGTGEIDMAKAREQRQALYTAPDAATQNQVANDMQAQAIAALSAIHHGRAR